MSDFKARVIADAPAFLRKVLDTARAVNSDGMLVFDLDSTVFDNRPRQARIVREFGQVKGIAELLRCEEKHFDSGWDLEAAMRNCGMAPADAAAHYKELKKFWGARFFTSAYCVDDVEVPGAAQYLALAVETGTRVVYVTGRHEEMRKGTVQCMEKCRMPVPRGRVELLMKPTLRESDDTYKRTTHAKLHEMGRLVAAFDNEPTHANDYAEGFPGATVVHLATDHSGRPVQLAARIVSVPDFRL